MSAASYRGALCLDLDGTLYGKDHTVSKANAEAVSRASKAGFAVMLCTGRSLNCKLPRTSELGVPEL